MQLDKARDEALDKISEIHEIRFRCPCCEKLYKGQSDVFEDLAPEFECLNCIKSFSLLNQLNSFGLYETISLDSQFVSCPKCTHLMPENAKECPSCGVFIEKYAAMSRSESPLLYELNQLWAHVIENFNQDLNHQHFLNKCQEKMALNVAFQKYDELRKSMNYDNVCEKYLKQIELRLEQQFLAKNKIDPMPRAQKTARNIMTQWFFAVLGFFGLALLIFNKIRPTFPNLSGLIVSITVLSFGVWAFSAQNKNLKL